MDTGAGEQDVLATLSKSRQGSGQSSLFGRSFAELAERTVGHFDDVACVAATGRCLKRRDEQANDERDGE